MAGVTPLPRRPHRRCRPLQRRRSASPERLFLHSIRTEGFMTSDEELFHETDFFGPCHALMKCYFILIQSPATNSRRSVVLVRSFFNASLTAHTFLPFSSVCANFILLIANDLMFLYFQT
ncbi:unnamed protein product [Miscanthus lutarioriparius]|uniref:Uncharacterized protein n=1 Tax=Miscanthus lutarioriparius TaxID=422564 RepID=A0A811MSP6_9POAL|nr:unnamed protein product [Miscanthus lutarioriparius]